MSSEQERGRRRVSVLRGTNPNTYTAPVGTTRKNRTRGGQLRCALRPEDEAPNVRANVFRGAGPSRRPVSLPTVTMPMAEEDE